MKRVYLPVVLMLVAFASGAYLYWRWEVAPLPIGPQPKVVEITAGQSLRHVAEYLQQQGVLPQAWDLVAYARLHEASGGLRAGEYRLDPGLTVAGLLALMRSGKVVMHSLTLVEGWTFQQALQAVETEPNLQHDLTGLPAGEIVQRLGFEGASLEGQILPDTYEFPRGTRDVDFFRRAHAAEAQVLNAAWDARAKDLPYKSSYDVLIMASLIEKETAQPDERTKIAGVFVRRLRKGMMLQTDPTVIYGLGDRYHGDITWKDLRTDTPYNTYTRYGLPPTPICLPSRASLEAAVHPEPGNALYFVSRGDGTHVFSATLKEQNAAVAKYQLKRDKP